MADETRFMLPGRTKPYVMAHRGNKVRCPENTLAAFLLAINEGADILETDLHVSADGAIVCIHDPTVERTTDGHGAVADHTLAKLKSLSASYGLPEFESERIPALTEVAEILPDDVALALELKSDAFMEPEVVASLLDILDRFHIRNRTFMLSFVMPRLLAIRAHAPDLLIGWITLDSHKPARGVDLLGPAWPILVRNPLYVIWAHLQGQWVCPLDPAPNKRLWYYRLLNCDAVLSDDPGSTIQALKRKPR